MDNPSVVFSPPFLLMPKRLLLSSNHSGVILPCLVPICNVILEACHRLIDRENKHDRVHRSRVPYRFVGRGELVYSVVWGTRVNECVGKEACRLSGEEVDRKTPKAPANCKVYDFDKTESCSTNSVAKTTPTICPCS